MIWPDKVCIGKHWFETIVAVTEDEHRIGLMGKPWPPPVMSFPYKLAEVRKFWMKNTPSPLDIVFVRNGKVIDVFRGEPYSLQSVGPDEPSDLVVELPAGTAAELGIVAGNAVKLFYSNDTVAKKMRNQY